VALLGRASSQHSSPPQQQQRQQQQRQCTDNGPPSALYTFWTLAKMTRPTLLQSQTNALLTLLNLNQPTTIASTSASTSAFPTGGASTQNAAFDEATHGTLVWKVLILDELSKDILATSLRVQDLREQGVTLHM
jgi:hypothetical protein